MRSKYKILLTGATGFVGRSVASALAKHFAKKDILCLGWMGDDEVNKKNAEDLRKKGFKVELVDLVVKKNFDKIPQSPDIVVHMAANVNTSDPDHRINDVGTKNLVEHLSLNKNTYFIHTSTTVHTVGHKRASKGINNNTPSVPTNEYGRTKLRAEKILIEECKSAKFRLVIVRLCTVYGPDPRPNSMFLELPAMIKKGSIFTRIMWPGKTALVNVNDVSFVISNILRKFMPIPGKPEIYIAYSENLTMGEISRQMHKALSVPFKPISFPSFVWRISTWGRIFIPYFEKFTSPKVYSSLWRLSLIIDNIVYVKSDELEKRLPNWKKKTLRNSLSKIF